MDIAAIINQFGGMAKVQEVAAQSGIAPDMIGSVMAAIGQHHAAGVTDPAALAASSAASAGIDPGMMMTMLQGLLASGGTAGLMGMATSMLDANKDGSVVDDLMGMAGKLFGRK
jgi:hypothetical protein